MWARIMELMLACWLAVSPFIFRYPDDIALYWVNDLVCAALIALFALVSFWRPLERIHLLSLLVVAWLIALAVFTETPPPPRFQNYAVLGVLILMLAIIPSHSAKPPQSWLEFYADEDRNPPR